MSKKDRFAEQEMTEIIKLLQLHHACDDGVNWLRKQKSPRKALKKLKRHAEWLSWLQASCMSIIDDIHDESYDRVKTALKFVVQDGVIDRDT